MANKRIPFLRFVANREGVSAMASLAARRIAVGVRFSLRDCWIGVRYTTFEPFSPGRVLTIGGPFVHLQFLWRLAADELETQP